MFHRIALIALVASAGLFPADAAFAIEKCKAKIHKKTGQVQFWAKDIRGRLSFVEDNDTRYFVSDAEHCVRGDKARKCGVGHERAGNDTTPPESCQLVARDDRSSCKVHVQGCAPAMRMPRQLIHRVTRFNVSGLTTSSLSRSCFPGETVVSGGVKFHNDGSRTVVLTKSAPRANGTGWEVRLHNTSANPRFYDIYAICRRD